MEAPQVNALDALRVITGANHVVIRMYFELKGEETESMQAPNAIDLQIANRPLKEQGYGCYRGRWSV